METVMATSAAPDRPKGIRSWPFALGIALLALALIAFIFEALMALHEGGYRVIAAGELWFRLHPYSLNLSQAVTQRYLHPGVWDPVMVGILQWPFWSIFGAPGAVLAILFGPWMRKRG